MKKNILLLIIASIALFVSCKSHKQKDKGLSKASKNITRRNYAINKENAFNDLFFDSSLLVNYVADGGVEDSVARRMLSFYNNRNYQFAWFSSSGVSEQTRGFWNMYKYYSSYDSGKIMRDIPFIKTIDSLLQIPDTAFEAKQPVLINPELRLTESFLRFFLSNTDKGYLKRKEIEKFIPSVKADPVHIADSLVNKKHKDDKYYGEKNKAYGALLRHLAKYVEVYKFGGWPLVPSNPDLFKSNSHGPQVTLLKKRLFLSEDLPQQDSTENWTSELSAGIKTFQLRHGYKPTGILNFSQLKDMNVSVRDRIEQILLNIGRAQWMIDQPQGRFIRVNIPEFVLHVTENGTKIFDMPVVVGMEGHNTTIFTGNLNQIVFAPYWNLPQSIIEKEILPEMEKDPGYLSKHEMEITGKLNKNVPAIRQLPGPKNSLGLVKFLFPNSYDIYFHDTPAKSLFSKEKRAFSHGCIRLSQPAKLASWLLKDDQRWDSTLIITAMHAKDEKKVPLAGPIPVLIAYYTSWVDEQGLLRFADDVYGHDAVQERKMFR